MALLKEIHIEGLFGLYDHSLTLRDDPPVTIVAGPNGIGKTTVLSLVHSLLSGSFRDLAKPDFTRLSVVLDSGESLSARPEVISVADVPRELRIRLDLKGPRGASESTTLTLPLTTGDLHLPTYVEPVGADRYIDYRSDEILSLDEVMQRYGRTIGVRRPKKEQPPAWFHKKCWRTDFIETKRLDSLLAQPRSHVRPRERRPSPIDYYLDAVREEMDQAKRQSFRTAQARDGTFALRLLTEYSQLTVNPTRLRERYSEVEALAESLTVNGLLTDSLDVLPAGKLNPTAKRTLWLFVDDFEAKMAPLQPIAARLEQLRAIVDRKFLNKTIVMDPQRGVTFRAAPNEAEIAAEALSSGEQHELALVSRLLFRVPAGTTVMIDEPELSLHVTWQHQMLDDLGEIAELVGVRFVLATHSTAIINGRWELVEELGPIDEDRASGQ